MRLPAVPVLLLAIAAATTGVARADEGDVLVQAGHQGRPESCAPLHVKHCNLGAAAGDAREREWTPVVADEATRALRRSGFTVLRRPADYAEHDSARIAVFLHFDGDVPACKSGASIGYPASTSREFAAAWKQTYGSWFPFRFMPDNFTENEHQYYGFRKVDAPDKMLIEFGELTCPAQRAWMEPRLRAMGDELARFLIGRLRAS